MNTMPEEKPQVMEAERPKLTKEELERRRYDVDFARANVGLEGFPTDDAYREIEERYARGEIDAEELDRYMDEILEERVRVAQGK